ncbi:hypothetical protein HID58_035313 [Brassica napus]|uniref:DUF7870 domain-containing protein n=1 Tax=Brassica napus TaxID=3708 RepID=A0ABQ8C5H3_BRANA|nr:hypothetical protein HID58_035313 [Brassica napus]
MGVDEDLKLKLTPKPSLRRALVIVFAFSVVSLLRSLNGGETHPCKVDECAVNFAFLGPFLVSGNGLLLSTRFLKPVWNYLESERCKDNNIKLTTQVVKELKGISDARVAYVSPKVLAFKHRKFVSEMERLLKPSGTGAMLVGSDSVSPVSSLLKKSSVVHVASFGEHVLVVFRRNGEGSFRLNCSSSVLNNRPYIGLLEPLLEEKKHSDIHYLPEFIDLSSKKRLVYIDIGAADHLTTRSSWFFPSYPIEKTAFNSYFVHHNTSVLTSYVKSPGVTFIYHPGLASTKERVARDQEEPFVEDDSFDFLEWFKETASFADFVVLKMNTSDAELKFLSELIKSGAICSVDELFLNCKGYRDCTSIIRSLRNSGVFVHQWWED